MQGRSWERLPLGSRFCWMAAMNSVFELDAVHGDVDLGDVEVLLGVGEVVVAGLVGAVVADVAEERAQRAVVVEGELVLRDALGAPASGSG